jgi:activating signal cointegrator 1
MKALTLHQPYASLVVLGVKWIETRSWRTDYRGPLWVHASKRRPTFDDMLAVVGYGDAWNAWYAAGWIDEDSEVDPGPLGAVVGRVDLVDCIPIGGGQGDYIKEFEHEGELPHQQGGVWLIGPSHGGPTRVEDQRPFGDFTSGRWAWLLENAEQIEPVPAKGHQRLWNWKDQP